MFSPTDGAADHRLAADIAARAGELLLALRRQLAGARPEERKAQGDRRSHELIVAALRLARPDDAILSEEAVDDERRLSARRVWIVDPLDGTREFAEPDRPDWAVHVALWEEGRVVVGAVAVPASALLLSTGDPPPAPPPRTGPMRLVVSRTRPPDLVEQIRARHGAAVLPMGSAGAKVAEVVLGRADAYVHAGGQYEWDSAAPVAVARAAGLHASRIDGGRLEYNRADPSLPDLLVCRAELAAAVLETIRSCSPVPAPGLITGGTGSGGTQPPVDEKCW